ncbi:MAG TPA: hypothetical protein VJ831_06370 [Jatrophihabitantaceae bacterium]|nr:hypothetical protein [Jatrophihabitantaceae bacterium]
MTDQPEVDEAVDELELLEPRFGSNARQAWFAAANVGSLRSMLGGGPPLDVEGTATP